MGDKLQRQKINERETNFSYEEKLSIAAKSNERCCHCGKKVYFGYGATVEHFVPLSKGGTNRMINLVMLCKNCNDTKSDFIYRPNDYLPYLSDKDYEDISGYFESYINSFDFVNRKNLLACDVYDVKVNPISGYKLYGNNKTKRMHMAGSSHSVKRVITQTDVERITEYYIKYLKKYGCLDDIEAAKLNILFWYTFGCIYYVEKNKEIKTFVAVTVTKANEPFIVKNSIYGDEEIYSFLNMDVFTYYSNDYSATLSWNLVRQIPSWISSEQNLNKMPIKINILKNDKISNDIVEPESIFYIGERLIESFTILCQDMNDTKRISEDTELQEFFDKFANINKENLDKWFKEHDTDSMSWMIAEVLLPESKKDEQEDVITE